MNLRELQTIAAREFERYGLTGWSFSYDRSTWRFGACYLNNRITMNPIMVAKSSTEACVQTLLHEIAHAIVGVKNKHNEIWAAQMVRMGLNPHVYYNYHESAPVRASDSHTERKQERLMAKASLKTGHNPQDFLDIADF